MWFSPMYYDMGCVKQIYYVWFEWGHFLSSSILWAEIAEDENFHEDSTLGRGVRIFGIQRGYFLTIDGLPT